MTVEEMHEVAALILLYCNKCLAESNESAIRLEQCNDQYIVLIEVNGQHHAKGRLFEKLRWDCGFSMKGPGRGPYEADFAFTHEEPSVVPAVNNLVKATLSKHSDVSIKAQALTLNGRRMRVAFHVSVCSRYVVDLGKVVSGQLDMINLAPAWTPADGDIHYALREVLPNLKMLRVKNFESLLKAIESACVVACGEYGI